jgi:glycosyltransferase involved in cell wall biosynthesis
MTLESIVSVMSSRATNLSDALVSVVVPTFNRVDCLANAVDSALAQTHTALEVLIVDDGSTDGTADLVRERWAGDSRVHYFHQANGGLSAARNRALAQARGSFAAYLDSDDVWLPWKIEVQLACMARHPDAVMIHSDLDAVDSKGAVCVARSLRSLLPYHAGVGLHEIYGESRLVREFLQTVPRELEDARVHFGDVYSYLLLGNLMMPSAVMVRRNASGRFERFDETLRIEEGYEYFLRVCLAGPVAYLDASSYRYERGRSDHLWQPDYPPAVAHRLSQSYLRVIKSAVARGRDRYRLPRRLLARQVAGAHGAVADSAIRVGARAVAIRHLLRCLQTHPRQRRAWVLLAGALCLPRRALLAVRGRLAQAAQHDATLPTPAEIT